MAGKRIVITGGDFEKPTPQPAFRSQRSYVQRQIEVTVKLAPSQSTNQPITFAGTDGASEVTLSGFRTRVRIQNSGSVQAQATIEIFGLPKGIANELSTLGMIQNSVQRNYVSVSAGDAENGLSPVYSGTPVMAYGAFNQAPKVPFRFHCQTALFEAVQPKPATSFPQSTDVATMMSGWARQMNMGFENNGVTVQLPPSYFPGTIMQQVQEAAVAAHIIAQVIQNKLCIWPIGKGRATPGEIPLVSKATGMIGYPSFAPNGQLQVRSLFNPKVAFGGLIRVQSSIPQANKTWYVQQQDLLLDAKVPKGEWSMSMICYPETFAAPIPSSQPGA